jgi:ketohexokinase
VVNNANGSRTILHAPNDLQELTFDEFKRAVPDVCVYSWIHFEGRNFDAVRQMIEHVLTTRVDGRPRVSVEAEKVRPAPAVEQLLVNVDVVFMSKDFARAHGWTSMQDAVVCAKRKLTSPHGLVICAWGEKGACASCDTTACDGGFVCVGAHYVADGAVRDTLGAGDTFIAAALHQLNGGAHVQDALRYACTVAGRKCTQRGLLGLDTSNV